jgi:hypothetical protein
LWASLQVQDVQLGEEEHAALPDAMDAATEPVAKPMHLMPSTPTECSEKSWPSKATSSKASGRRSSKCERLRQQVSDSMTEVFEVSSAASSQIGRSMSKGLVRHRSTSAIGPPDVSHPGQHPAPAPPGVPGHTMKQSRSLSTLQSTKFCGALPSISSPASYSRKSQAAASYAKKSTWGTPADVSTFGRHGFGL